MKLLLMLLHSQPQYIQILILITIAAYVTTTPVAVIIGDGINDQDGSLGYGPLVIETSQPVYDFAARDRFVWCASGVGTLDAGLIRIDLGQNIENEPLRFAWANDLQVTQTTNHFTTGVAFVGTTNRLAFCTEYETTDGAVYIESATVLRPTGYVTTGAIRYGTLEPKNYKFIRARPDCDEENAPEAVKLT